MAKLTGKHFKEIARVRFTAPGDLTGIFVLRSDRKVLRRFTGDISTGYSVVGTLKPEIPLNAETLARIVRKRGLTPLDGRV